jgi:hypothetical protein
MRQKSNSTPVKPTIPAKATAFMAMQGNSSVVEGARTN